MDVHEVKILQISDITCLAPFAPYYTMRDVEYIGFPHLLISIDFVLQFDRGKRDFDG